MPVSLYAEGAATIEVGKYGMTLEEAKTAFLKTCEECGCVPTKIKDDSPDNVVVQFEDLDENLYKLLNNVADVDDLHGDPPSCYTLETSDNVPAGEYVRTGSYND